jgi:hypothetical protein
MTLGREHILIPLLLATACADDDDDSAGVADDLFEVDDDDAGGDPIDLPSSFALDCPEAEPNDPPVPLGTLLVASPPWAEATDCGEVPASNDPGLIRLRGSIADIVEGTWDGDNDGFRFTVREAVTPSATLQWDPLQGDLDANLECEREDGSLSRLFGGGLSTAEVPETADAAFELKAGATCWVFISGFSGRTAAYDLWLE